MSPRDEAFWGDDLRGWRTTPRDEAFWGDDLRGWRTTPRDEAPRGDDLRERSFPRSIVLLSIIRLKEELPQRKERLYLNMEYHLDL